MHLQKSRHEAGFPADEKLHSYLSCWLNQLRGFEMIRDLTVIARIALVIYPTIYFLFYVFSQGHFAY